MDIHRENIYETDFLGRIGAHKVHVETVRWATISSFDYHLEQNNIPHLRPPLSRQLCQAPLFINELGLFHRILFQAQKLHRHTYHALHMTFKCNLASPRIAIAPRRGAAMPARDPLKLPNGVRAAETIHGVLGCIFMMKCLKLRSSKVSVIY